MRLTNNFGFEVMVMLGLLVLIAMRSKEGKVVSMTDRIKV